MSQARTDYPEVTNGLTVSLSSSDKGSPFLSHVLGLAEALLHGGPLPGPRLMKQPLSRTLFISMQMLNNR